MRNLFSPPVFLSASLGMVYLKIEIIYAKNPDPEVPLAKTVIFKTIFQKKSFLLVF